MAFSLITILISLCITDHGEAVGKTMASGDVGIGGAGSGHRDMRGTRSWWTTGGGIVEGRVLPVALMVMLFAIPYSATQSFLVQYVARIDASVDTAVFFSSYAIVLIGLRAGLRNLFDRAPYDRFVPVGIASSTAALFCHCIFWMGIYTCFLLPSAWREGMASCALYPRRQRSPLPEPKGGGLQTVPTI